MARRKECGVDKIWDTLHERPNLMLEERLPKRGSTAMDAVYGDSRP
jgi:hypothetical protein